MATSEDMQALEAQMLALLNEQRRQDRDEARQAMAGLSEQVTELQTLAQQQQTEGQGLVGQLTDARATIEQGRKILAERETELAQTQSLVTELLAEGEALRVAFEAERTAQRETARQLAEAQASASAAPGSVAAAEKVVDQKRLLSLFSEEKLPSSPASCSQVLPSSPQVLPSSQGMIGSSPSGTSSMPSRCSGTTF